PAAEFPVTEIPPSFSADGRVMAVAGYLEDVLVWRPRAGRGLGAPPRANPPAGAGHRSGGPDRPPTVVAGGGGGIQLAAVATLRRRTALPGSDGESSVAQFTPDGHYMIGGSTNGTARLWSTKTWHPVGRVLAGHTGQALPASVSPDGHTVATGSSDGTI